MTMKHPAWWLLAALLAGAAWALDPPKPAPPAPTGPAAAAQDDPLPPEAQSPAGPADEELLPPPAPAAGAIGPTPQRFDPSEKVRADFPVSFPIDI
jgi:hypothetical protein